MIASRGMGAISPSKMPGGKKKARRDDTDFTQYAEGGKVNAAGNYTKPGLRKKIVSQVKAAATHGTGAGAAQTAQVEKQISAMSRASGVADTEYRKALEALVRGTKDVGIAMNDMNLVMDISKPNFKCW